MIRKSKQFLNLPIITCNEGITVGKTVKFLINATDKKVSSIIVNDDEYYKGVKLLPVNLILGVGNDALVIDKSNNIVPYTNIATAEDLLKEKIEIISSTVINNHGIKEGIVDEFEIDDDYNIVNIIINKNTDLLPIPINKVKVFGKNLTIIEDLNANDVIHNNTEAIEEDTNEVSSLFSSDNIYTNEDDASSIQSEKNDISISDTTSDELDNYDVYFDSTFTTNFKVGNKEYKKGTLFNKEILEEIYSIEPEKLKELVNVLE